MRRFLYRVITGQAQGWQASLTRAGLFPLSLMYGLALGAWDWHFRRRAPTQLPCPVVSVGNILAGGTGKTVIAAAIARHYHRRGYRVGLIVRGYGGRPERPYHVVSEGRGPLISVDPVGDEAIMLARQLPGVRILAGRDRVRVAQAALERWPLDVLVLDDAFQYRRLARQLDIVAVPAVNPWGTGRLLPCGMLRESPQALARADLIVLTHADQVSECERAELKRTIRRIAPQIPLVESRHAVVGVRRLDTGESVDLCVLRGKRMLAVSGIGTPARFHHTLRSLGLVGLETLTFEDHHRYSTEEIRRIQQRVRQEGWDGVLTTEKDAVKLPADLDWYVLQVRLEILAGEEFWEAALAGCRLARGES